MIKRQISTSIFSFLTIASLAVTPAFAVSQPTFFSCLNPQGVAVVTHADGVHGVPGVSEDQPGVDTVYAETGKTDLLSSSTVVQCLCPTNGQGVQTNWWKASDLSEDEIKVLESEGWIYIPSGSAWGLSDCPYLAQNTNFSCNSSSQNPTSNNGTSSNSSSSSSSSSSSNSTSVLGASTLAYTGNIIFLYSLLGIGILSSGISLLLRKK